MQELVSILLIGISLSMDTFSLCLSLGALNSTKNKLYLLPLMVGVLHFFMPLLGNVIGKSIIRYYFNCFSF